MARYGQVESLKSDNGPQFSSEEFQNFAKDWNFKHVTSSPGHSQSNGFIEKMVAIAKGIMRKAKASNTDPYLAFLEYRNTPIDCGYSPAQLLMGRRLKSLLPSSNDQLKPGYINHKAVRKNLMQGQSTSKQYYDKNTKSLPPLSEGQSCRVQFGKIWKPAIILEKYGDRSYKVRTEDGAVYHRNRRYINKTRENFPFNAEFSPNILQSQASNNTQPEAIPALSPSGQHSPKPTPSNQTNVSESGYQTRSGRVVKPNKLYDSPEWSKRV